MVGKLRVRLSCLWPNTPLSAELPLLGERSKGAQVVGAVRLSLQANYASTVGAPPCLAAAGCRGGVRLPASCQRVQGVAILQCSLPSPSHPALPVLQKALVKGYTAPALPKAAYTHGVDDRAHQQVMARESRRIVMRWLDSANPAIGAPLALTVLDAER